MAQDSEIQDVELEQVITWWMQYLVRQFGKQELECILDKYLAMKWIDESIKDSALKSAETINISKSPDPQYDDHIGVSYLFIQKLNGKYINEEMLPPYEKEIVELKKIDILKDDSRSVISINPETLTETGKKDIKIVQMVNYPESGDCRPEDPTDRSIKEIDKGLELLSEKKKEFELLKSENKKLQQEIQKEKVQLQAKLKQIEKEREDITKHNNELKATRLKFENEQGKVSELESSTNSRCEKINRKQEKVNTLLGIVESKQKWIVQLKHDNENQMDKLKNRQQDVSYVRSKVNKETFELTEKQDEFRRLKKKVEAEITEFNKENDKLVQLKTDVEIQKENIEGTQRDLERLNSDISSQTKIYEEDKTYLELLLIDNSNKRSDLKTLDEETAAKQVELEARKIKLSNLKIEVDSGFLEFDKKNQEIGEIRNSIEKDERKIQQARDILEVQRSELEEQSLSALKDKTNLEKLLHENSKKLAELKVAEEEIGLKNKKAKELEAESLEYDSQLAEFNTKKQEIEKIRSGLEMDEQEIQKTQAELEIQRSKLDKIKSRMYAEELELKCLSIEDVRRTYEKEFNEIEQEINKIEALGLIKNKLESDILEVNNKKTEVDKLRQDVSSQERVLKLKLEELKELSENTINKKGELINIHRLQVMITNLNNELEKREACITTLEKEVVDLKNKLKSNIEQTRQIDIQTKLLHDNIKLQDAGKSIT